MDIKGRTALVTGASSGIGVHLARQLAARGANLVITARRADRLHALAAELRAAHCVDVTAVPADLGDPAAATALFDATEGRGQRIDLLVNNAGFGTQDPFVQIPWDRLSEQLQLNVVSLTELCWRFAKVMRERRAGHILNVASVGAWFPVPHYATYAAGKAYVRNLSEALATELAPDGVVVSCLCPGPTATEFMDVAGHALKPWQRAFLMPADRCAAIGLRGLERRRRVVVPGIMNWLMTTFSRFIPRRLAVSLAGVVMGKH